MFMKVKLAKDFQQYSSLYSYKLYIGEEDRLGVVGDICIDHQNTFQH